MLAQKMLPTMEKDAKERQLRKPSDSVVEPVPEQNGRARELAGSQTAADLPQAIDSPVSPDRLRELSLTLQPINRRPGFLPGE